MVCGTKMLCSFTRALHGAAAYVRQQAAGEVDLDRSEVVTSSTEHQVLQSLQPVTRIQLVFPTYRYMQVEKLSPAAQSIITSYNAD
jgi:hypothetical protein